MSDEIRHRLAREVADQVVKDLAQDGKVIFGGWRAFEIVHGVDKNSPVGQALYDAYYSGAQHLFSSIMNILEEGQEATEGDLNKVTAIHEELEQWVAQQKAKMKVK